MTTGLCRPIGIAAIMNLLTRAVKNFIGSFPPRSIIQSELTMMFNTLYTVDVTEFVTAQIDATFHEGRGGDGERLVDDYVNFTGINARMFGS